MANDAQRCLRRGAEHALTALRGRTRRADWSLARSDYGTHGEAVVERPDFPPASSDTVLVSRTRYEVDELSSCTVDAEGIETQWKNNAAGQRIRLIEGIKPCDKENKPRITDFLYAPDGGISHLILRNDITGDQVTRFLYGVTLANSGVARSDWLREKIYPIGELGSDQFTYNRQGQIQTHRDGNGTIHAYDYDSRADRQEARQMPFDGTRRARPPGGDGRVNMGRPTQDRLIGIFKGLAILSGMNQSDNECHYALIC